MLSLRRTGMLPPGVLRLAHVHSISPPSSSRTRSTVACVPRTYFLPSLGSVGVVIGSEKTRNSRGPPLPLPSPSLASLSGLGVLDDADLSSCCSGFWVDDEFGETRTAWHMNERSVAPNGSLYSLR